MSSELLDRNTFASAHPELGDVARAVATRDWQRLRALVEAGRDASDRTFLCRYAAETPGAFELLEPEADQDPWAAAIHAEILILRAWEARSSLRAEHVGADQFKEFRRLLVESERLLTRTIAKHPEFGQAWVVRLITCRGLQLGRSEARRRWSFVERFAPDNYWAHSTMLQYWAPKWFGTWDLMHEFAQTAANTADTGSPLHALIAQAQMEKWIDLGGGLDGGAYLREPDVARLTMSAATRGPSAPQPWRGLGWQEIDNQYAMLFSLVGEHAYARVHFDRLNGAVIRSVWRYLEGEPTANFAERNKLAQKAKK